MIVRIVIDDMLIHLYSILTMHSAFQLECEASRQQLMNYSILNPDLGFLLNSSHKTDSNLVSFGRKGAWGDDMQFSINEHFPVSPF